jgi:hypothetical protein
LKHEGRKKNDFKKLLTKTKSTIEKRFQPFELIERIELLSLLTSLSP